MVIPGLMRSAFVGSDNVASASLLRRALRLATADKSVYAPAPS
jgi:hypothetical protein